MCRKTAMNWAQVTPKRQQQAQVLYNLFLYSCLYFYSYKEFLIQILQIVRNMQNSIETRGNLCTELGPPVVTPVQNGNTE